MAVGLLLGLAPGVASAQGGSPTPPADAPVVAGPAAGGLTLVAFDHGGELCVALHANDASCDPPPDSSDPLRFEGSSGGGTSATYGVVTADVASVEVLVPGSRMIVPATTGAYHGQFADRVRFFLAARSGNAVPYRVLAFDAQGRAVRGQDLGDAPPIGRSAAVASGQVAGSSWHAVAFQRTMLAPTPLDRARIERITCVRVDVRGPPERGAGCSEPGHDPAGLSYSVGARCTVPASTVTGLAGPAVRRLEAVLGDGTHRTVVLHALPARFGETRRAFALVLADDVAVRALLVSHDGRTDHLALGTAPAQAQSSQRSAGFGVAVGLFGFIARPAPGGGGPLVARDDGDDICIGLGTIVPTDCQLPPTEPLRARIERRRVGVSTAVLAVATPDVSAVRLHPDRGAAVTVPTADLPAYAGRYVGLVRAATVSLPGDRRVYATDLLAADGRVLGSIPGPDQRPLARTPRILARLPGGVTVAALGGCVQVRAGRPTRDRSACGLNGLTDSLVSVPCAAHRTVIVARLAHGARGVTAATSAGTVRGKRHGRLALAILPPRAALREIRLTGAARIRMHLPPAARQCGYAAFAATPLR
jgi:hypothetical protein